MSAIRELDHPFPRPRWGWLYAVVALLGGLLTLVEVAMPDGVARGTLEFAVTLAMLGAMALWVRANRVALALANEDHRRRPVTYNRARPWTTAGAIPKPFSPARARRKRGSTAAS
jgi:hypothetical protein